MTERNYWKTFHRLQNWKYIRYFNNAARYGTSNMHIAHKIWWGLGMWFLRYKRTDKQTHSSQYSVTLVGVDCSMTGQICSGIKGGMYKVIFWGCCHISTSGFACTASYMAIFARYFAYFWVLPPYDPLRGQTIDLTLHVIVLGPWEKQFLIGWILGADSPNVDHKIMFVTTFENYFIGQALMYKLKCTALSRTVDIAYRPGSRRGGPIGLRTGHDRKFPCIYINMSKIYF